MMEITMAKRLNPHRRLLQRQGNVLAKARIERALEGDDSGKLQQGSTRTSQQTFQSRLMIGGPRFGPDGNSGKSLKRPGVTKRHSQPAPGPAESDTPAQFAKVSILDVTRLKATLPALRRKIAKEKGVE